VCFFADGDVEKAVQHAVTVGRESQCRVPKPRLVQVKDVYPHPSKTYIPHCTILHQCGDDTGCCKSDTLTCTARRTESVDLYFYVSCCPSVVTRCKQWSGVGKHNTSRLYIHSCSFVVQLPLQRTRHVKYCPLCDGKHHYI
jgi:hypothetical protein